MAKTWFMLNNGCPTVLLQVNLLLLRDLNGHHVKWKTMNTETTENTDMSLLTIYTRTHLLDQVAFCDPEEIGQAFAVQYRLEFNSSL